MRPNIEETPPYARSGSFASMDTPVPFEARATQAFYYVTPVEKDWDAKHVEEHLRLYNPPVVAMINVHEAYPGHYLQFLYAKRFPTKVRKLLYCGTNAEELIIPHERFRTERMRLALSSERSILAFRRMKMSWAV